MSLLLLSRFFMLGSRILFLNLFVNEYLITKLYLLIDYKTINSKNENAFFYSSHFKTLYLVLKCRSRKKVDP